MLSDPSGRTAARVRLRTEIHINNVGGLSEGYSTRDSDSAQPSRRRRAPRHRLRRLAARHVRTRPCRDDRAGRCWLRVGAGVDPGGNVSPGEQDYLLTFKRPGMPGAGSSGAAPCPSRAPEAYLSFNTVGFPPVGLRGRPAHLPADTCSGNAFHRSRHHRRRPGLQPDFPPTSPAAPRTSSSCRNDGTAGRLPAGPSSTDPAPHDRRCPVDEHHQRRGAPTSHHRNRADPHRRHGGSRHRRGPARRLAADRPDTAIDPAAGTVRARTRLEHAEVRVTGTATDALQMSRSATIWLTRGATGCQPPRTRTRRTSVAAIGNRTDAAAVSLTTPLRRPGSPRRDPHRRLPEADRRVQGVCSDRSGHEREGRLGTAKADFTWWRARRGRAGQLWCASTRPR
ncbi:hypothetical protein HBB16_04410 [Pseudonocardia sp. MCCB 268]|nr:hypothetical protein [Pseudonocardia cytotoxica]